MKSVFVFNGDADGLCALQQLRLAEGDGDAELITGPKRKTALVQEVKPGSAALVTVLDVSLLANRPAVDELLARSMHVRYFDHHDAGQLPLHPCFEGYIDTSPRICTSVIVDRYVRGASSEWALVGAFGDNLDETAHALADRLKMGNERKRLRDLGICLNYNAYGEREEDLFFAPAALHARLIEYTRPIDFIAEDAAFGTLWDGFQDDLQRASALAPAALADHAAVYLLPDAPWARRVSGALANQYARKAPQRAHAILSPNATGALTVSVRAPLDRPTGASEFCRQFAGGGGRSAAAGINNLPPSEVDSFISRFMDEFNRA